MHKYNLFLSQYVIIYSITMDKTIIIVVHACSLHLLMFAE